MEMGAIIIACDDHVVEHETNVLNAYTALLRSQLAVQAPISPVSFASAFVDEPDVGT